MLGRLGLARFLAATLPSLRGLPGISPQGDNNRIKSQKLNKKEVTRVFIINIVVAIVVMWL
jgi:hypothetical protein